MISFRIGPGDATVLGKYFEPVFESIDLTRLHNQNIFISMIIDGEKAPPFSGSTLRMPDPENDLTPQIVQMSRERFASARDEVDADIRSRTMSGEDANAPKTPGGLPEEKPNKDFLEGLKNPNAGQGQSRPSGGDRRDRDRDRGRGPGDRPDRGRGDRVDRDRGERRNVPKDRDRDRPPRTEQGGPRPQQPAPARAAETQQPPTLPQQTQAPSHQAPSPSPAHQTPVQPPAPAAAPEPTPDRTPIVVGAQPQQSHEPSRQQPAQQSTTRELTPGEAISFR
jgi:hypothetical protein